MKLYFDSLTTLKVIHAESPIVIFFGTYGIYLRYYVQAVLLRRFPTHSYTRIYRIGSILGLDFMEEGAQCPIVLPPPPPRLIRYDYAYLCFVNIMICILS